MVEWIVLLDIKHDSHDWLFELALGEIHRLVFDEEVDGELQFLLCHFFVGDIRICFVSHFLFLNY